MSFLKSTWSYLPFANYRVNPSRLQHHLPKGTDLDLVDGYAYISLVGLRFENTRILNMPVPYHINFSEINLRFYVKNSLSKKSGVVFIKEIVDRPLITLVANKLYHERYETMPVTFELDKSNDQSTICYKWKPKSWQEFSLTYSPKPLSIVNGSMEQYILERYYGFSSYDLQTTFEYEVEHASWKFYNVLNHHIDVDFKMTYGDEFEFLNHQQPESIMMASGSRIAINNKRTL